MIKDLLRTMLDINNDTILKPSEKVLLSSLILYHNYSKGYSYPNYEHLQTALSTKRKATVSNTLKSLEEKKYITIEKTRGNKNIYFINKYLYYVAENTAENSNKLQKDSNDLPKDSNGNKPLEHQVHVSELFKDNKNIKEICDYTGFNERQTTELLDACNNDKVIVLKAYEYMKAQKSIKDPFKYTLWAITNKKKIQVEYVTSQKELRFNNFKARDYDYDRLEKKLLGWEDDSNDLSDYRKKA